MLTESERIATLRAMHQPEHLADPMVLEVWEDGEVTITKGGALYGQRILHCLLPGDAGLALPPDALFRKSVGAVHSRIVVPDKAAAHSARALILG